VVRFNEATTLDRRLIAGNLGDAPTDWLGAHRLDFLGVFGFGPP